MRNMEVVRNGVEVKYVEKERVKVREALSYPGWRHSFTISIPEVAGQSSQATVALYLVSPDSFLNAYNLNLSWLRFSDRTSVLDALMAE
jgi:hypothetical protein